MRYFGVFILLITLGMFAPATRVSAADLVPLKQLMAEKSMGVGADLVYFFQRCSAVYYTTDVIYTKNGQAEGAKAIRAAAQNLFDHFFDMTRKAVETNGVVEPENTTFDHITAIGEAYIASFNEHYRSTGSVTGGLLSEDLEVCRGIAKQAGWVS